MEIKPKYPIYLENWEKINEDVPPGIFTHYPGWSIRYLIYCNDRVWDTHAFEWVPLYCNIYRILYLFDGICIVYQNSTVETISNNGDRLNFHRTNIPRGGYCDTLVSTSFVTISQDRKYLLKKPNLLYEIDNPDNIFYVGLGKHPIAKIGVDASLSMGIPGGISFRVFHI